MEYEYVGVPLGIWSARMVLRQNIDSWVTIDGEQAYIVYKGQIQSCKHCHEQSHAGISCVQNKKLLLQKSYANVTKQVPLRQTQKSRLVANRPVQNQLFVHRIHRLRLRLLHPKTFQLCKHLRIKTTPIDRQQTPSRNVQQFLLMQTRTKRQCHRCCPTQQRPPSLSRTPTLRLNISENPVLF